MLSTRFCLVSVSLVCFGLLMCTNSVSAESLQIVSYNVENLFHPKHDSIMVDNVWVEKDDYEWTPSGERHWSYKRYQDKVENIARVLTNIGEWDGVDIIGLQEVENAWCISRLCRTLGRKKYDFVHYESPDRRGIDVALIYKKSKIDTISTKKLPVYLNENETTRDILYIFARINKKDSLHLFVCHMPSQRGGKAQSEWKRKAAKGVLQKAVDSVFMLQPNAKIIVMGDMNSAPEEDLKGLKNRMKDEGMKDKGTHKYRGQWTCLDQFYTSPAIDSLSQVRIYDAEWIQETDEKYLGLRPKRSFNGYTYQKDGFSDHLPIILNLKIR